MSVPTGMIGEELYLEIPLEKSAEVHGQRKPAVVGAATERLSERPELYLDYVDSIPTGSAVEPQR